jgi:orotidine-5'-phosphate decarboxylase
MKQADRIIVALDQMSEEEIAIFLDKTKGQISKVKIGLELFLKYGPTLIKRIFDRHQVGIFLDLKLHDIPTTVQMAIRSLKDLPIEFLTVHLGGGEEMLNKTMAEARLSLPNTKILGVSFLTCLAEEDLKNIYGIEDSRQAFIRLFELAHLAQLNGIICSPYEVELVKAINSRLLALTPGIRFSDDISKTDQKRVASPIEAFKLGADYLVMGRSLTKADDLNRRLLELQIPLSTVF